MSEKSIASVEPFADDKLDRKRSAEFLTKYLVGRHGVAGSVPGNESFVLNVNAEWGLGKTYFLKQWGNMLRASGHPVVYFDAWQNDFVANPFVSFMAEIEGQLTLGLSGHQKIAKQASSLFRTGAKVIKAAAPKIALTVIKNFSGIDADKLLQIARDSTVDSISEVRRDLEKENKDLKLAIYDFKKAFAKFTLSGENDPSVSLPVFLMVDELDRCRPTYAIELLENIKHIFRIPNVYTIVATDSRQLAHSIKAIYGAEFDSEKYLRRFFDHESRLDQPNYTNLVSAMLALRNMTDEPRFDNPFTDLYAADANANLLSTLAQALRLTTRDVERCVDIIDSIRLTYTGRFNLFFLAFLTMLYITHSEAFETFQQNQDANALRPLLTAKSDNRIMFPEIIEVEEPYSNRQDTQVPAFEWCFRFTEGVYSDKPAENGHRWLALRYALNAIGNANNGKNRLRQYHDMVSLAGHFSM